jgi:hypothetical protein
LQVLWIENTRGTPYEQRFYTNYYFIPVVDARDDIIIRPPDNDGHTKLPDVTEQEVCFAAVIIQMGHNIRGTLKD